MERGAPAATTRHVKYVYLDIVDFTKERSVEAQTEIVAALNAMARQALDGAADPDEVVLLPTGDGMGIALLDPAAAYDAHFRVALALLEQLDRHNAAAEDARRRFQIRLGLNEHTDNVVVDVNGRRNLAGVGINMAQRVMALAEGGHLLVGATVYETVRHREQYMAPGLFRPFEAVVKHGVRLQVYQYIGRGEPGLRATPPAAAARPGEAETRLTLFEAYYLAYALKHARFLLRAVTHEPDRYAATLLLYFLAEDAVQGAQATAREAAIRRVFGGPGASPAQQFAFYGGLEYWVCREFAALVGLRLRGRERYFDHASPVAPCVFPNAAGAAKLHREYPQIWQALDLGPAPGDGAAATEAAPAPRTGA